MTYNFGNQRKRSRYIFATRDRFQLKNEQVAENEGNTTAPEDPKKEPESKPEAVVEPEDLTGLKSALKAEREAVKIIKAEREAAKVLAAQREAELEKFKDHNPEEYKSLLADRERNNKAQAEREAAAEKLNQEQQAFLAKHQLEIQARDKSIEQLRTDYQNLEKDTALRQAFFAAKGNAKIADDGTSYFKLFSMLQGDRFAVGEDKSLTVIGSDGKPVDSVVNKGKPMGVDEYIRSLHQHPVLGACFVADVPSGMGGNHGFDRNASTGQPKSQSQMSSQERQAAIVAIRSGV